MAQNTTPVRILSPLPKAFYSRSLQGVDDNKVLLCATAQVATVDRDIGEGFGCSFKGPISFTTPTDGAGLAAVVNDVRTTGATNPWCALVCTARDVYDVIGSKA